MLKDAKEQSHWFIKQARESHCVLQDVSTFETLELKGALALSFMGDGKLLNQVANINPAFAGAAAAYAFKDAPMTLGRLLKGSGWGLFFLELTGRCNENCVHCYASSSPQVEAALSWPTIEKVIREVSELGFSSLQLTGGDPLVSPHIVKAAQLAAELQIPFIEVYTNGLALRRPLAELFASLGIRIAFSVYSHDAAVHDEVTRTPGSHKRTIKAILLALSLNIKIRVSGIQGCASAQDERALRLFLIDLGLTAEAIGMDRQRPVGRGKWQDDVNLIQPSAGDELVSFSSPTHGVSEVVAASAIDVSTAPHRYPGKLSLNYLGEVTPCIFQRNHVLGRYDSNSLNEILNQEIKLKDSLPLRVLSGEPLACFDCRQHSEYLTRAQILSSFKSGLVEECAE